MIGVLCISPDCGLVISGYPLLRKGVYVRIGCIASAFSSIDPELMRTFRHRSPGGSCHALRIERIHTHHSHVLSLLIVHVMRLLFT